MWHTICEGETVLKQQGRRTRFSGARHLVTTHGERKAVAATLRFSPGFGGMDEAHSLHLTFEAVVRVNPGGFPLEDAFLAQRRLEAAGADLAAIDAYWERIHRSRFDALVPADNPHPRELMGDLSALWPELIEPPARDTPRVFEWPRGRRRRAQRMTDATFSRKGLPKVLFAVARLGKL